VVYWMQRAQRGLDNPALDVAVQAANALGKPVVVFFAPRLSLPQIFDTPRFLRRGFAMSRRPSRSAGSDSFYAASPNTAC
jgi:hypothetical protein